MKHHGLDESFIFHFFRHGKALYQQGIVSYEEANDLDPVEIPLLEANAEAIANSISPLETVLVCSSPFGRALHTAKVLVSVFDRKGIRIETFNLPGKVRIIPSLGEVANFSWDLFCPLVQGGEVSFEGEKFCIEKEWTNPENLDGARYFNTNAISRIPQGVRSKLPYGYVQKISSFETFEAVTSRFTSLLRAFMLTSKGRRMRIIATSHEALGVFAAIVFTNGKQQTLDPASYVTFEKEGENLFIKQVGKLANGCSERDYFRAYERHFHLE